MPKAIMIQGVSSSAGKSLLAAALCRLLWREGYAVAPFKAQNMSLNSWVTADGQEMGIAQALQARACGLAPNALMNPVLLKPMGTGCSQLILLGKPHGVMTYREYTAAKRKIWRDVTDAYAQLGQNCDVAVIEGAGSPAEINLRAHDIVNMRMARHSNARVLLVADIDRGGAFAALAGTMCLLGKSDRACISAFALNKFRGDATLLKPALNRISRQFSRPFAGIMPWIADLGLPDEDSASVSERIGASAAPADCLDIAIIQLPAMSNMADFEPFLAEPRAHLRLVRAPAQLGIPHAAIIPGSRNVPEALRHLRASGLAAALADLLARMRAQGRGQIIGICAGLEIMGTQICDPYGVEARGAHAGLGLLPIVTILERRKTLRRVSCAPIDALGAGRLICHGQEIHHGRIESCAGAMPCICSENGEALGYCDDNPARAWGCWLHGVFDADAFRHAWLDSLGAQFGLGKIGAAAYDPYAGLDRLADIFQENMSLPLLKSWLLP